MHLCCRSPFKSRIPAHPRSCNQCGHFCGHWPGPGYPQSLPWCAWAPCRNLVLSIMGLPVKLIKRPAIPGQGQVFLRVPVYISRKPSEQAHAGEPEESIMSFYRFLGQYAGRNQRRASESAPSSSALSAVNGCRTLVTKTLCATRSLSARLNRRVANEYKSITRPSLGQWNPRRTELRQSDSAR